MSSGAAARTSLREVVGGRRRGAVADAEAEAQQAVVDRVLSWQEGAPVDTVRAELQRAAAEVGVEVDDDWLDEKARQISDADPAQR